MRSLDWYFDFVSPYSYLQHAVLPRIAARAAVRYRPIFFAGLLNHWGHLGPAEIPPKREWTFRHCVWLAERAGIPIAMPTMHPFNPLSLLRASIAKDDEPAVVARLFRYVWVDGHVPTDEAPWRALLAELGLEPSALEAPRVKERLKANGDDALAAGVFGVPSAVVDGQCFWGFEATDMLLAYLDGDAFFGGDALAAAKAMRVGPMRPQAARPRG